VPTAPIPILVVDDDGTIAGLLAAIFRKEGFAPTLLRDGRAALDHVAREAPAAAAVLDVMLPYTDGFSVAAAIRADPRWGDVPIVMLSARSQPADLERARVLGVGCYLVKPFQPQALVAAVRDLLAAGAKAGE
jgi:two-component system catabolic regulation response regulator CreB